MNIPTLPMRFVSLFLLTACSCFAQDFQGRADLILDNLKGDELINDHYGAAAARLAENPADTEALAYVAGSNIFEGGRQSASGMKRIRTLLMAEEYFTGPQKSSIRENYELLEDWNEEYTDNHRVQYWTTAYLLSETFNGTWNWSGESLSSAELRVVAKNTLIAYGQSVFDRGYSEFLSPIYDVSKIASWMNLYDYAQDAEVRAVADAMLTYHFTLLALSSFNEVLMPPFSRGPSARPDNNIGVNSQWVHWLFWNLGGTAIGNRISPRGNEFILALTSWRPPEVTNWIATGAVETPYPFFTSQPFFFAGDPRHMVRTSYRGDTYAISSGVYQMDMNALAVFGNRQMVHDDAFAITWDSPSALSTLSVMHPYWNSGGGEGIHDWRSRQSPFMQAVQHENTAIVAFDIPGLDPWFDFPIEWSGAGTRAEVPLAVAEIRYPLGQVAYSDSWGDDWVTLTYGDTYIAINILQTGWRRDRRTLNSQGYNALISQGTQGERWQTGFVFVCGSTGEYPTVADFMADVMAQPVVVDWEANTIAYTTPSGNSLLMTYNTSATLPDFSVPAFSVDGVAVDYAAWPRLESPWTSLDGTLLEIINTVEENRYVVDWSGGIPVLETRELDQSDSWAGYPIGDDGWVDTGSFMGWVFPVEPFVYVADLGKYIYLPEAYVLEGGAWVYVP